MTRLTDIATFFLEPYHFIFALLFTINAIEVIIIKIILAIIFTLSVVSKLTGKTKATFDNAGYPPIIMYATAIAEIILVIVLFTRYELLSTLGLLAIMAGAVFTLFRQRVTPAKYALALVAIALLISILVIQIASA